MAQPLVIDVMEAYKVALLNEERAQMADMAQHWLRMEAELSEKVELFVRRVKEDGLTVGQLQSRQFQLDRYRSLLAQVQKELAKYTDYAEPLIARKQAQIAKASIRAAAQAIQAVGADNGIKIAFDRLNYEAVENMIGLAGDGSPLRDLLEASYGDAANGMLNQLIGATARGENPIATARLMMRNGLSQSLSRMMSIARTEQMRVHRQASQEAYRASGVVSGYRRLSAHDSRVCAGCLAADGMILDLGASFAAHPNCRCTTVPIVMGMEAPQWKAGGDWLAEQDEITQRKILGAGRFDLYRQGVPLSEMMTVRSSDTWGDAIVPATISEIKGRI